MLVDILDILRKAWENQAWHVLAESMSCEVVTIRLRFMLGIPLDFL